ncbi:hypothetical protein K9M74_05220 [Candidatus Woesearchaeota archaeon]|nr:hypothetical protein [Candidatus Woesearchaeota archaeon]
MEKGKIHSNIIGAIALLTLYGVMVVENVLILLIPLVLGIVTIVMGVKRLKKYPDKKTIEKVGIGLGCLAILLTVVIGFTIITF